MRTRWRSKALLVAVSLAAAGLAGGSVLAQSPAPVSVGQATKGLEGVTISYWTSPGESQAMADLVASFEAATGVQVETEEIAEPYEEAVRARFTAGERPDLLAYTPDLQDMVLLDPANTLVDLSDEDVVGRTRFGLQDVAGVVDGRHYAAVIGYPTAYGMLYDRDTVPSPGRPLPTSLDELYDACASWYDDGNEGAFLFVAGGSSWPLDLFPRILWADAVKAGVVDEVDAGTTTLADPRFVEGINALNSSIYHGCLNARDLRTATYEDSLVELMEGGAGVVAQSTTALDDLVAAYGGPAVDEKVGFFPLSMRDGLATWLPRREGSFVVPRNADPAKEAAALAFVRFASGEGYPAYLAASGAPPVLEGYETPAGLPRALLEADAALEAGAAPDFSVTLLGPWSNLDTYLWQMIDGSRSPDDVAAALAADQEAWLSR